MTDPDLETNLDNLIARRGLGLAEFALEAGIDRNTVLRLRRGRGISPASLRSIREALDRLPEIASPVVEAAS